MASINSEGKVSIEQYAPGSECALAVDSSALSRGDEGEYPDLWT